MHAGVMVWFDTYWIGQLAMLFFAHFLADYPLQGDFLSKAKNRIAPIPGAPWWQALVAHSGIHAGFVWLITGQWWLAIAELAAHAVIDDTKCAGHISFNQDQAAHIVCKCLWVVALIFTVHYGNIDATAEGIPHA